MNLIISAHWTEDDPARAAKRVARKLNNRHAMKDSGGVVSFTKAEVDPLLLNALRVLDLHETANYEVPR